MLVDLNGKKVDLASIDWTRTKPHERLSFGRLVRDLRIAKRLTQQDLADMAGVDRKTIGNIESGRTAGQPHVMESLFLHLGVSGGPVIADEDQQFLAIIGPMLGVLPKDSKDEVLRSVLRVIADGIAGTLTTTAPSPIHRTVDRRGSDDHERLGDYFA